MTPAHKASFARLFDDIYKGHAEATKLSFDLLECAHAWDDYIDEGKAVEDNMLFKMLFDIGGSFLWTPDVALHFKSVYIRWHTANTLEGCKEHLDKAWYLRASLYDLFVMLAEKLYGVDWAIAIAPAVYAAYGETLEQFLKEMNDA